jgi:Tol biopolymer transport system component
MEVAMTIMTNLAKSETEPSAVQNDPSGNTRFDWIVTTLSLWTTAGYFLVGWASSHGRSDYAFPMSWAAPAYLGLLALLLFLFLTQWRNRSKGYAWRRSLPQGYGLSLAGAGLALIGGVLYILWQQLFAPINGVAASLVMPALAVAIGLMLIVAGPLRAARARFDPNQTRGWILLGPLVLSMTLALSVLTNLTLFASPIFEPFYGPYGGKTVQTDQGNLSDLYLMNTDGTGQTRLTSDARLYAWSSDWSPDGQQIVFTQGDPDDPESSLYIMNINGSELRQLTDMPGAEWLPSWSDDGKRIAFVSKTERDQQIFSINADGSDLRQLTETVAPTYGPEWSPDGAQIVYNSNASGSDHLYTMNADGSDQAQITARGIDNWDAAWSPDGTWIAFHSSRDGNEDIYLIRPDGSAERRLTEAAAREFTPAWSPDGRQIAFVSEQDGQFDVYTMNADGSNIYNLTNNHALEFVLPRWSPDGTQIMVTASGHRTLANAFQVEDLGVAGVIIQSTLLMGAVLLLVTSWTLPVGALTVLFTLNGLLMAVFDDRFALVIPVLATGIIADLLVVWLKPSIERRGQLYLFALAIPVLLHTLYFLALEATQGIGWNVHLWLGALVLAGLSGWLVSFLIVSALGTRGQAVSP